MAATTPVLGGTTMAQVKNPGGFEMERVYRGGIAILADGTAVVDLVASAAKHVFRLSWENITNTEWLAILTAFATIDDGSATFVAPNGTSYTVMRDPGNPSVSGTMKTVAASAQRWDAQMTLREQ
jgi:hypothetical protein